MEPELQVLPALVYLLIYQEFQKGGSNDLGLDSILRRLRLQTGGSAGAGGGAASGGGRLQPFICSLGWLPTGAATAGSGPTVSRAGGGACGGACGGVGSSAYGGAGRGGGRLQPFFCSLRQLPTGAAPADSRGASGSAGGGACGCACAGLLAVLAALQVAGLVVVLVATRPSPAASDGSSALPGVFCPFLTLTDGGVTSALTAGFFKEAFLGGSCSLPVLHAGPFFPLAGGGRLLFFAGVGGTLAGLMGAPFEPL
ncbi:hypothetical protein NDU88_007304 [Pleurodeles waltl]|uniref:Uncharacterized protein n=1 Tax=Pleurodeles waltl TaxID=8319 RepID=A0AAV7QK94_PLEWA|nr:hypothetical protein NDU88_007304 [Pleurodeles waltl]